MNLHARDLDADAAYKLLSGVIVPRPIAWVTTLSPGGIVNAAPFSAFTWVSNQPPLVAISIVRRGDDALKDTARNIEDRREFVVNVADWRLLREVHLSAVDHPPEVSEVAELGLATAPSVQLATPRLAAAPVALECRWHRTVEFGEQRSALVIGEVVEFHFRDGLCVNGKVDSRALAPIARLGGRNYAQLGEIVAMPPLAAPDAGRRTREGERG